MNKLLWRLGRPILCFMLITQACNSLSSASNEREFDYAWHLFRKQIDASRPDLNAVAMIDAPFIDRDLDPIRARFNREIQALIDDEIAKTYEDVTTPVELDYPGSMSMTYEITSSPSWSFANTFPFAFTGPDRLSGQDVVLFAGHHILSVVFTGSIYFGGVHPSSWHRTINYDLTTGRRLKLGDLFSHFTPYLKTVADSSIRDLSTHEQDLFPEYAEEGAAAREENYRGWALTPRGLFIIFDEYQVAPYMSGPQYVLIPYDALANILNPRGPLGQYAR